MLYDKHRGAPAIIPCEGLSDDDVSDFCQNASIEFFAIGTPDNWNDTTVFRAATMEYPARGCTVTFAKVLEWKNAMDAMGERVTQQGRYRSHTGEVCTTLGEAIDDTSKQTMIVYQTNEGHLRTCPTADFFKVVHDNGKLVPRFAHIPG